MKALELLRWSQDKIPNSYLDTLCGDDWDDFICEAIKELEDLQKDMQVITDEERTLKDFVFTNCNECVNKVDNYFTETCLCCKRYYGCYFEKKETK